MLLSFRKADFQPFREIVGSCGRLPTGTKGWCLPQNARLSKPHEQKIRQRGQETAGQTKGKEANAWTLETRAGDPGRG